MTYTLHISASLLAADHACLGQEITRAEAGGVDSFHFDFMDGHYVPNIAFSPEHLNALRPYTNLPFHVHLELSNPEQVLAEFEPLRADMLIFQEDTCSNLSSILENTKRDGFQVGLGISPHIPLERIKDLLPLLDLLLILGVQPGFGGQLMVPDTVDRIIETRKLLDAEEHSVSLAVDGGVNLTNTTSLLEAGAEILIIGTAMFAANDIRDFTNQIRSNV